MTDGNGTLEHLLTSFTKQHGPAVVEMTGSGTHVTSYESLSDEIRRYAAGMQRDGMEPGQRVALAARTGTEWIKAFLALLGAGAVPIPLDTQLDAKTLRHILEDSGADCVLTDQDHSGALEAIDYQGRCLLLDAPDRAERSWHTWKAEQPGELATLAPDDLAVLFYTSGTTGPPKGVPLKHRHIAFQLDAVAKAGLVRSRDRILQPLPLHHVYPLIVGTLAPLSLGLPVVLPEAMTGPQIIAAIREGGVTFVVGVPGLYRALLSGIEGRLAEQTGLAAAVLGLGVRASTWLRRRLGLRLGKILLQPLHRRFSPKLRVLASGGAALDPELAWRLEGLGWQVAVGYGLTETSPLLTLNPPGNRRLTSVGRPIPGIELRIDPSALATETEDETAAGNGIAEGEILARGPSVFDGYLGRGETEPQDEIFTADGWFRTGDLGRLDSAGYLFVTGRRNTMIVTGGGKNIRPEDLEERYAQLPAIAEVGILGSDEGLAAVVVPDLAAIRGRGAEVANAVRRALTDGGKSLASYKRISQYQISGDPLPRTRLGKIQRHRLKELYAQLQTSGDRAPRQSPAAIEELNAADRELLNDASTSAVWEVLVRRYTNRSLTPDTSLQFDLGIDSLGWLELGTDISQHARIRLDEERIVEIETVRDLLQMVRDGQQSGGDIGDIGDIGTPLENPEAFLSDQQKRWLEPLSPGARRVARGMYAFNRFAIRRAFRLQVSGIDRLPSEGPLLIAPNHTSFLDPFSIAAALPRRLLERTFWGGWTGHAFRNRVTRTVSRLGQVVPIDPDRAASSSLAFAAAVLQQGRNLVWFPEGERSATGELLGLKPGLGLVLEHCVGVTVVPTHIEGAYQAWPRHRSLPRFKPIRVTFGAPIESDALARRGRGEERRARITDALEAALREMDGAAEAPS